MIAGLHVRKDHLKLIATSHIRNSLRSGAGVIFLVLSLLLGLVLASIAGCPADQARSVGELVGHGVLDPETPLIEQLVNEKARVNPRLLDDWMIGSKKGKSGGPRGFESEEDFAREVEISRAEVITKLRTFEADKGRAIETGIAMQKSRPDSAVGKSLAQRRTELAEVNARFGPALDKAERATSDADRRATTAELLQVRKQQLAIETKILTTLIFDESIHKFGPQVIDFTTDASDDARSFMLTDKPALITLFLILLTIFLPFLTALGAFNQTAGDIGTRGLRYLLLRTERANIYLGRMIGTYLFTLAIITIIIVIVGTYILIKVPFYENGDKLLWLIRGWFACAVFALPWVALCAWISALIPMPFLSLLVSAGGLAFFVIITAVGRSKAAEVGYAAYATPWGYKWWLFDPSLLKMFGGVVIILAFTAVFVLMGLRTFNKRDV